MYRDAVDLREFYRTSLGQVAQRMIRRRIRQFWPELRGQIVLGLGYATPYLRPFKQEADRVFAVMPASQGVVFWPPEGPAAVTLADEAELPFADMSVDRVLVVHCLEGTDKIRAMMREIWRVLAGGGRLLVVVPNRSGLWARIERTPFGHGRPYSASQLREMMREHLFVPERSARALFVPPVNSRFLLASAPAWEEVGERWFERFAGVTVVEASKQLYAAPLNRVVVPARRPFAVPVPGRAEPASTQPSSQRFGRVPGPATCGEAGTPPVRRTDSPSDPHC
jgi:SAM-dependent methyltransferase